MADMTPSKESDMLRVTEIALARQRRRAWWLTMLPTAGAVVFVGVVTTQVQRLEAERQELAHQASEAEMQQATLSAALRDAGQELTALVAATSAIEELVESRESFLRSLDEARFLIDIRMRFDSIHLAIEALAEIAPGLTEVRPWRTWVAVIASAKSPIDLQITDAMAPCVGPDERSAVLRSPNGFYALVLPGDGTFTSAYRTSVSLQERGCAPGAYFADAEDWPPVQPPSLSDAP